MPPLHPTPRSTARPVPADLRALVFGAALAALCWAVSAYGDPALAEAGLAGPFALVMVVCGSAAFVLHALHLHGEGRPVDASVALPLARRWALLLGLSFCAVLTLLH